MSKKERITEAEWPIMAFLWECESATSALIVEKVSLSQTASPRTIKALLHRLVAKNLVGFTVDERNPRMYHYRALISREQWIGGVPSKTVRQ